MDTMFVITKEGVYRHEIVGIYSHRPAAIERAKERIKDEGDDYHKFEVMECEVNAPIEDGKLIAIVQRHTVTFSAGPQIGTKFVSVEVIER